MAGNYWIKLYIEILDDSKMATLPAQLWKRTIEMFLLAGRYYKDGKLPDTNELAWALRCPMEDLDLDLRQLAQTGIIKKTETGWLVINFAKRQAKMTPAEKMEQYRKRQRREQYYGKDEPINVTDELLKVTQITDNRLTDNRLTDTEADESTPFNNIKSCIEQLTGIPATPDSIKPIEEIVQFGGTPADISEGYKWFSTYTDKTLKYYGQLVGPTRTAMSKRLGKNGNRGKQPAMSESEMRAKYREASK